MASIEFQYAYLILTIPFLALWLLFFIINKNTRKEQLTMSLLLFPLGPFSELLYFSDYWRPASIFSFNIGPVPVFIEDLLFAFFVAGIASVIYEVLLAKRYFKKIKSVNSIVAFSFTAIICLFVSLALFFLGVNSIFATSIGAILAALFILNQRRDFGPVAVSRERTATEK